MTTISLLALVIGRSKAAALFVVGGAGANVLGLAARAALTAGIGGGGVGGGGGGRGGAYVPPPWESPCYALGAGGGFCALLGYLAAAVEPRMCCSPGHSPPCRCSE